MMDLYIEPFGGVHDHGARQLGAIPCQFSVLNQGFAVPLQSKFFHFCYTSFAGYFSIIVFLVCSDMKPDKIDIKVWDIIETSRNIIALIFELAKIIVCFTRKNHKSLVCNMDFSCSRHSAQQRNRTSTSLPRLAPKASVSTVPPIGQCIHDVLGRSLHETLSDFKQFFRQPRSKLERTY